MPMVMIISGGGATTSLAVTSYTGTSASNSLNTSQDTTNGALCWFKRTNGAASGRCYDSERGGDKQLEISSTSAEGTVDGITSFDSTGVTITGTNNGINNSGDQFVLFSWLVEAGYLDIVTYTGNGTNRTISHNLGAVPSMMIVKCRSNAENWAVYHASNTAAPETDYLTLNEAFQTADDATYWNDTAPTDSVFSVGTAIQTNNNAETYVTYLFAEQSGFSKFGSYSGDGTSSNAITGLGFEPSVVLTKRNDSSEDWALHYNDGGTVYFVEPNNTDARGAALLSMDSDGFTLNSSTQNASGGTYIYAAWA